MVNPPGERQQPCHTRAVLFEPPFVGRDAELAELCAGLEDAAQGVGRFVLLLGEPGIGKTRLAREFTNVARMRGARVVWGRCWEAGGAPSYWPWAEILREVLTGPEAIGKRADPHTQAQLVHILPDLARQVDATDVARTLAEPDTARFLLFEAVATLLRTGSESSPLVVVLDDLQMADRPSLALLTFLARTLSDSRVMLTGTCRDTDTPALSHLLEPVAELRRHGRQIHLHGLSTADVRTIAEGVCGGVASDRTIRTIHDATNGNPFFIDELLRATASFDRIGADPSSKIPVPDGVRSTIQLRLSSISNAARHLLDAAAVMGREFDVSILACAVNLPLLDVLQTLDEPRRRGIVVEENGLFIFRHALIREFLYDDLAPDLRLQLHQATSKAFQDRAQANPDRYCAQLAHHSLAAAPLRRDDAFVDHAMNAARLAMARMAFEEATSLLEKTVAALPHASRDDRRHCEILLSFGEAQEWAGDGASSRETFRRAADLARRISASDLLVRAALGVGAVLALKFVSSSRCEAAPDLLKEALDVVSPDDTISRARILSRLALHGCTDVATSNALELSAEAVRAARASGDPSTLVHALSARHGLLLGPDDLQERLDIAHEVLDIANHVAKLEFLMRGYALLIVDLVEIGDMHGLDAAIAAHQQLSEETGDRFERWANLVWRSMRTMMEGRLDEAERLSRAALQLADYVAGPHTGEIYAPLSFVGQSLFIAALREDAPPDLLKVYDCRSRYPELATLRVAPAYFLARDGRIDDVRRELTTLSWNGFRDFEHNVTRVAGIWLLAEPIRVVGDREVAGLLYSRLLPYRDRNITITAVASFGSAHHALALLAATLDRWDDAAGHFEAALGMNGRMGARPHVALASYDYARLMPIDHDPQARERAVTLAEDALRLAREIGMHRLEREAGELLRRLRDTASLPDVSAAPGADVPQLVKDGDVWVLTHRDERTLLKPAKGFHYVAELLRRPGREVHVLDLLRLTEPVLPHGGCSDSSASGRTTYGDEVIDARARRAYRRRLGELTRELESAAASGDPEQAACVREEVTALRRELSRAVTIDRRPRHNSDAERARINVTRTIRLALARIVDASPAAGAHLARTIRTGIFCSYVPEAECEATPVSFIVESAPAHASPA